MAGNFAKTMKAELEAKDTLSRGEKRALRFLNKEDVPHGARVDRVIKRWEEGAVDKLHSAGHTFAAMGMDWSTVKSEVGETDWMAIIKMVIELILKLLEMFM